MARTTDERLDCLMEQLEKGTQNIFESGRYAEYLAVMSKFHHYSFRNTILIFLQNPNASHVAGFHAWNKDFGRRVKAGEHGIQILAPCPKRKWMDHDKIDPATGLPVKDENGNTMQERTIITIPRYRVVTVFDVSQTEGKELPSLGVAELYGDVPNYQCIYDRLVAFSPVPVSIEPIAQSGAKGYFSDREQRIVLRSGMSEVQTVKTLMHEIAHAVLHNAERLQETGKKTRGQKEVEAESVAYVVCRHFGIDVSDYSFGYVAGWSRSKELRELHEALNTIRKTAAEIIDAAAVPTREHERKQKIYSH